MNFEPLDPTLARLAEVSELLLGPTGPFALERDEVFGETMEVYAHRPRSLGEIANAAADGGDRPCLIFSDGRQLSFIEFRQAVADAAAALRQRGIERGDRVAIFSANNLGWILTLWGATALGAVVVAMNGWWSASEAADALALTEPALLVADTKRLARLGLDPEVEATSDGIPVVNIDLVDLSMADSPAAMPEVDVDEDDDAVLLFTSGTTGRPKAAALTHRNVIAFVMTQEFIGGRGLAAAGRTAGPPLTRLAVYPLFHVSGLGTAIGAIRSRSTSVWLLGRFDAAQVIELTTAHGIQLWGGTITHLMRLLAEPSLETIDRRMIQQLATGGSATTPELIRRVESAFPHLAGTLASGYGSTESGGLVSYATNMMLTAAPDCVGPILPTVQVRIVAPDGSLCGEGEIGSIEVRSPLVMRDYWNNPQASAEVLRPGRWARLGDYGRIEHGMLFIASRLRDLILRGGENVYPYEIENRIDAHPDVEEVAVVGVDDDVLGQRVAAVVFARPGSTLDASIVRAWCAATLASFKVPEIIEIRQRPLPRNAAGKIVKHVLLGEDDSGQVDE